MENLFDYATKELSQDAFLRWLLESHDDEDLKEPVRFLLNQFCDLKDDEQINKLKTWAQRCSIDITVEIDTNYRKITLFIEDKAFSGEHNQLKTYNLKIDRTKDREIYKVFYKTSMLTDWDKTATHEAAWKPYDIIAIYHIFQKFCNTNNIILQQYISYLKKLSTAVQNAVKPQASDGREDWLKWESYFLKKIVPVFKDKYPIVWAGKSGQYPYVSFGLREKPHMPYLEVRSRDCTENRLTVLILCYGVKDFMPQDKVIEKIKADNFFKCDFLRHKNGSTPKQIGKYTIDNIDTDEKFIAELNKCATYFSSLMQIWYK